MIKLINYHVFWLYFDTINTRRNWIFQQTILCSALDKNLSAVLVGQKSDNLSKCFGSGMLSILTIQIITVNHLSLFLWAVGCSEGIDQSKSVSALCFSWIGWKRRICVHGILNRFSSSFLQEKSPTRDKFPTMAKT